MLTSGSKYGAHIEIERRRKNRDNASLTIGEDSDGHLRLNTTYPNGAIEVSMPILSGSHYRMIQFCGMESKRKLLEVSWDEMQEPIMFIVKYKCRKLQTKNVGRCNYIL